MSAVLNKIISFAGIDVGYKMPVAYKRWTEQFSGLTSNQTICYGKIYSEYDLDDRWNDRFGKYKEDHGIAYWSWKPYLICKELENMEYGQSFCYIDGGCVLPTDITGQKNFIDKLCRKIDFISRNSMDMALTSFHNIPCGYITRKEIAGKFNLQDDTEYLYKFPHWQSGLIVFIKNERTEKLMHAWRDFYFDNYESCIRFPFEDKTGQIQNFIHNGVDQAILECLLYVEKFKILNINDLLYVYRRQKY